MDAKKDKRKNLYLLAFTLVVVMLGYGMIIPLIPFYVESMGAGGSELGLLVASYALMRLLFGPVWGSISDRIGRKPVLMIGVFGYAITMLFFGFANQLWMLFVARLLSGILSSATAPTTMAYISDSTTAAERGGGMGVLGAAVGLGTVLGPGLGGWFSSSSLSTPFFIAAGFSIMAVFLIWFLLPESLPATERRNSDKQVGVLNPQQLWQAIISPIGVLLGIAFVVSAGVTIFYGIFGLYALERYGYGPQQVGTLFMELGLVSAIAQGGLSGLLTRRWGEVRLIKVSLFLSAIAYLLMLPADSYVEILLSLGFFGLVTSLMVPAITALTSRYATLEQGITMGLSNSFMSLGRIAGPLWGGFAFDLNVNFPNLSGAGVMLAGFVVSLVYLRTVQQPKLITSS
jgi:DHA1 family multidrug resistance protein-like MFS transporter